MSVPLDVLIHMSRNLSERDWEQGRKSIVDSDREREIEVPKMMNLLESQDHFDAEKWLATVLGQFGDKAATSELLCMT